MKKLVLPAIVLFSAMTAAAEVNKTKAAKMSSIDPRNIFVPDYGQGFHFRSAANYGSKEDFSEFVENIRINGVIVPLTVKKVKPSAENNNCEYELVYGFRRMEAVTQLLAQGADLPYVPAIVSTGSDEDRLFQLFAQDTTQIQLNVIEQAEIVKALIDKKYDAKDIPARIGKSLAYVYNLLAISKLPKKVKDQIVTGKISTNAVLRIMRKETDTEKIGSHIADAIANAQNHSTPSTNGGERRATAANVTITSSNDKKAPFEKLKSVYRILDAEGVTNEKMAILEVLLSKAPTATVDELAEIVRGGKAPKAKPVATPAADTTATAAPSTSTAKPKKAAAKSTTKKATTTATKPAAKSTTKPSTKTTAAAPKATATAKPKAKSTTAKAKGAKGKTAAAKK